MCGWHMGNLCTRRETCLGDLSQKSRLRVVLSCTCWFSAWPELRARLLLSDLAAVWACKALRAEEVSVGTDVLSCWRSFTFSAVSFRSPPLQLVLQPSSVSSSSFSRKPSAFPALWCGRSSLYCFLNSLSWSRYSLSIYYLPGILQGLLITFPPFIKVTSTAKNWETQKRIKMKIKMQITYNLTIQ